MAVNIGPRIGVDGEAQYRAQINNIVQATKTLKAEMEQTAQEFKRSGDAMGSNKAKAEQLTKAIELQRDKVDKLRDMTAKAAEKYGEADTRTLKWKEALAQAQTELSRLEGEMGNVNPKIKALADTLAEAGNKLKAIGDKAQAVGKTLTTKVSTPIVAAFGAALKVTADFDESMSKVAAVSGAVGEDFDKLRAKAREMGEKTKFSASEAADAMNYMAMAGWKTADMLDGVEGIMNLAAASGEDLATTSDIVTDALTAFGMSAGDSGRLADILAAASSNANTNVSMLGESFKYAAPVVGALGGSAEDAAVALGLMANAGIKASQGGTALRTGLSNLVNPSDKMAAAMGRYNVALVENADGTINLRDTMKLLRDRLGGLTESEQAAAASTIFGKNAMSGWLAIINASDDDFDKLTSAIDGSEGAAENMANVMQNNLSGQAKILKSKIEELGISFGDILMPYAIKAADKLKQVADAFNGMSEGTKKTIVKVAAFAAAAGPVILIVGKIASAVGSIMSLAPQITAAIGTASAFVSSTLIPALSGAAAAFAPFLVPAGLIIAGIVAATVLIVKNWDSIKKGAAKLKEGVAKAWEWFKVQLPKIVNLILPGPMLIIKNWDKLKAAAGVLKNKVVNAWNNLKIGVVNKATALKQGAEDKLNALKTGAQNIAENLKKGVIAKFEAFKTGTAEKFNAAKNAAVKAVSELPGKVAAQFTKLVKKAASFGSSIKSKFKNIGSNAISGIISGIKGSVGRLYSSIKSALSGLVKKAKNALGIKSPSRVFRDEVGRQIPAGIAEGITSSLKTVTSANEKLMALQKDFAQKLSSVENDLATKTAEAWDGYYDSVDQRAQALFGELGSIFDRFESQTENTTESLISNLKSQTDGMKSWVANITELEGRIGDGNLMQAIREMGPDAAADVGLLTKMSDEELNQYVSLWQEKMRLCKEQATRENAGLYTETLNQTEKLKTDAAAKMGEYTNAFVAEVKSLKSQTQEELKTLAKSFGSIGKDAIRNLTSAIAGGGDVFGNSVFSLMQKAVNAAKTALTWKTSKLTISGNKVKWNSRAYNNPLMFSTPTIVGGRGFGDGAGGEIVIGKDTMLAWIRDAVNGGGTTTNNSTSYGDINVVVNAAPGQNVRELADLVADRIQQQVSMRRRVR